ncbi:nitroreductase family protein [Desulfospira joergensenii]|uniref:nitroreductase family protein n=1 Tax=Desulfospira joergensenii TaxID=53329 RepID=UPI0003B39D9E|nr:nitroreductase family protein [Desulfospira joergensenii]
MFFDLIKTRRSIRRFKDKPVEKEKIDRLMEAALRSPSSRSFNPWRFIVVDRPDLLETLSRAKPHGASFLKSAPLGIVVCGDASASDVWVEDCSIASMFIHLAAHSLELGSCWIQIRKRDHDQTKNADAFIKETLKIPDHIMIESIIAVGYPDEVKKGHGKDSLHHDKISYNTFSSKE